MKRLLGLAVSAWVTISGVAFADTPKSGTYELDGTHASLTWRVNHMGLSDYTARFTRFDAELILDTENPENSRLTATLDPASVETDYPGERDFDAIIAGENLLNAAAFPEITFVSKEIRRTGETTADIVGDLTLLGVTREVTLSATLNGAMDLNPFNKRSVVGFSGVMKVDRTLHGMNWMTEKNVAGPEVEIIIQAEFLKVE